VMARRIRIMHVVDNLLRGGLENGLVNLVQRMNPDLFEHTVCSMRLLGPNADQLSETVPVFCLATKESPRTHLLTLIRAVRSVGADIVHSRNWGAVEAVIAGKCTQACAVVHSEHGLDLAATVKDPRRRTVFRRLAFELADKVLTVSNELKQMHSKRTGFPAGKISVIHNGVDDERFSPDASVRANTREELGFASGDFCIGCVGSLFPVKDHMTLLRAVAAAAECRENWRLVFIGEGPERPKLEAFLNNQPWRGRVSFLGVSARVPALLNAMDVYVLPSIYEGISNSLLEAMSSGLPVVASTAGGNPELVVDGDSGLLFPVGDSPALSRQLKLLYRDAGLRNRLGRQARYRVQKEFSLKTMVQAYERMYQEIAGSRI
jgi:sugar transferase (PEP-CTERM/EpsH1 system associated)